MSERGIIVSLMPLKLLQANQNKIIYYLPYEKTIIFNKETNSKYIQDNIIQENYIYIFVNSKVGFSKKKSVY